MFTIDKKNARIWSMLGMRRVLGIAINELATEDDKFVFVTADVARYFGAEKYAKIHPNRYIDVGIAEQNMLTVAAGLQKEGMNTIAATYATFITARVMDQIRVSVGYMNLPIIMVGVGGGLAEGDLSATHMGIDDVAMLRAIPNIVIIEPADCAELLKVLYATANHKFPVYIRLTGRDNIPRIHTQDYSFEVGKSVVLHKGSGEVAFITAGVITATVLNAAKVIKEENAINADVIEMATIKPIDQNILEELSGYQSIVVVEEHMRIGGLGTAVSEYYAGKRTKPRICILGVDDYYPNANDYVELLKDCGLDTKGIVKSTLEFVNGQE